MGVCLWFAAETHLPMLSTALAGVTLGTRSRLLATAASFKAEGEGAEGRALWCVWAGDTALTLPRWPWPRGSD